MVRRLRAWGYCASVLLVLVVSAELAARLDDWIHDGTPFLATPNREYDLGVAEPWGFRGRPGGSFRKWKLNNFGFRGPEIPLEPPRPRKRLFVLGASETFGLYEDREGDYPARLRALLTEAGRFEVVSKTDGVYTRRVHPTHPFDVVGWRGDYLPYRLAVEDVRPLVADRSHVPPSGHTVFKLPGCYLCVFTVRAVEKEGMWLPFFHRNLDYCETIGYHFGDFFSRGGVVGPGMVTVHPVGLPHGPQPPALAAFMDERRPAVHSEVAIMADFANPTRISEAALALSRPDYMRSWADYTTEPRFAASHSLYLTVTDGGQPNLVFLVNGANLDFAPVSFRKPPEGTPSSPTQVGEAVLVGPGAMPIFGAVTDDDLDDLAAYVQRLQDDNSTGAVSLGGVGPVAEGLAAIALGLGAIVALTRWIGAPADAAPEHNQERDES